MGRVVYVREERGERRGERRKGEVKGETRGGKAGEGGWGRERCVLENRREIIIVFFLKLPRVFKNYLYE